ncbi:MAG TPA: hypothetical protein VFO96_04800 [Gemmatimonadales bacterium]|jgi:hypothetical protein|nr:hypothetical protein [Gemmatimonadales bacterium]
MSELHPGAAKPQKRSPFLIAAYCTLGGAMLSFALGAGVIWVLCSIGLAVLLALADLFLKLRER